MYHTTAPIPHSVYSYVRSYIGSYLLSICMVTINMRLRNDSEVCVYAYVLTNYKLYACNVDIVKSV